MIMSCLMRKKTCVQKSTETHRRSYSEPLKLTKKSGTFFIPSQQ
jgi:hypothetical protein